MRPGQTIDDGVRPLRRTSGAHAAVALQLPASDPRERAETITLSVALTELELFRVLQVLRKAGVDMRAVTITGDPPTTPTTAAGGSEAAGDALAAEIVLGDVTVRPGARSISRHGEEVHVSPKELELLLVLLRHRGRAVSREMLAREVWNAPLASLGRTIDTHICTLRRKLGGSPSQIRSVAKLGYRLDD